MAHLLPYLNFDNNCREAMTFYKECFGGELMLQKVSESPEMASMMPPSFADSILHSVLTSGNIMIMASDLNREKRTEGNTVHLCLQCDSEEEIADLFAKLSAGGKVVEAVADMPWGAKYGALVDKFGKNWMLNYLKS